MKPEPMPFVAPAEISDRDLVLQFESLGDNCELGLVQRRVGAEPLGLLRFAGAPLPNLLRALAARFNGLADPTHVRLQPENGEYMVKLTKYDFIYHADARVGEADPTALHRQQIRTLPFLVEKLLEDLRSPTKVFVFRQNEPLLASDLIDLRQALDRHARGTLLWVQAARPGHPAGSVDRVDDRLFAGYVSRLASREDVPNLDLPSWLGMLRKAYALWRIGAASRPAGTPDVDAEAPSGINLQFGMAGNAQANTGAGWSAPENGYTWSIGERSLLTLPGLAPAEEYWLEMDATPFTAPPRLPAQRLTVIVSGEAVCAFDPLARGRSVCAVPGHLVRDRPVVEIQLEHPHAASPCDVAGETDTRPLAVAFRSLSLSATGGVDRRGTERTGARATVAP